MAQMRAVLNNLPLAVEDHIRKNLVHIGCGLVVIAVDRQHRNVNAVQIVNRAPVLQIAADIKFALSLHHIVNVRFVFKGLSDILRPRKN